MGSGKNFTNQCTPATRTLKQCFARYIGRTLEQLDAAEAPENVKRETKNNFWHLYRDLLNGGYVSAEVQQQEKE